MRLGVLVIFATLLNLGCKKTVDEHHPVSLQEAEVKRANRDVQVPEALVQELEHWYILTERKRDPTRAGTDMEIKNGLKRELLDLELTLVPKSGSVLATGVHFRLPTGGGVVDLDRVIEARGGGFWVQMGLKKQPEEIQALRLFYISDARRRTVAGDALGAGCNRWAEMTSWFNHQLQNQRLDVYGADQRYLTVLAGTWLFAVVTPGELHLGTIAITDSRYPRLLCSRKDSDA